MTVISNSKVITKEDIINKTKGFAKEIFGMEINIPIIFSKRMTRKFGSFVYSGSNPIKIKYSEMLLGDDYEESTVDSIILHELTHWFLFVTNKPFKDNDKYFIDYIKKVGSSVTKTIHICGDAYYFKCQNCNKSLGLYNAKKTEKIKKGKYVSSCCKAEIVINNEKVKIKDNYERPQAKEKWIEDIISKYSIENCITNEVKPKNIQIDKNCGITLEEFKQLKRVTNTQMIPLLKMAIDNNNINDIISLKNTYTKSYLSSLKYLGKKYNNKLNNMLLENIS